VTKVKTLFCLIVATSAHTAVASAAGSLPTWPNADIYWGALVNVQQYITSYLTNHPDYFAYVKLATDVEYQGANYSSSSSVSTAEKSFKAAYDAMTAKGIMTGNYISGTTVAPVAYENELPYAMVRTNNMPSTAKYCGAWPGESFRQFVCNSDAPTITAFHNNILNQWKRFPAPIHFIDNAASYEGGDGKQPWAGQCHNMAVINQIAQSIDSRAIFNIAMVPGQLSDADMDLLISSIPGAGVSFEQPWQEEVSRSVSLTEKAVQQYRQLLDARIAVVMIQTNGPGQATSEQLKSWVLTWRKPGDHLYLSQIFWQEPDPNVYFLE
jgi:hypothetical protein